jgi:hypothetical protein
MAKPNHKAASSNRVSKTRALPRSVSRPLATAGDDTAITALKLAPAELSPEMAAYFAKCEEKLGFVPNVLKAYAFDMGSFRPSSPCTTT